MLLSFGLRSATAEQVCHASQLSGGDAGYLDQFTLTHTQSHIEANNGTELDIVLLFH